MGSKRDARTGAKESCVMANALSPNALPPRVNRLAVRPYRECDASDRGPKPTIDVSLFVGRKSWAVLAPTASLGPKL